jgi:hypothetical protein
MQPLLIHGLYEKAVSFLKKAMRNRWNPHTANSTNRFVVFLTVVLQAKTDSVLPPMLLLTAA